MADMRSFGSGMLGKLFAFGLRQLTIKNVALEQDFYAPVRQEAATGAFHLHNGFDGGGIDIQQGGGRLYVSFFQVAFCGGLGNGGGGGGATNTVSNEALLLLVGGEGGLGLVAEVAIGGDWVAGGDEGALQDGDGLAFVAVFE